MKLLKGETVSILLFLLVTIMIQIVKGQVNTIDLTLDEESLHAQHNYVLKFTHVQAGQSKILYAPDVSSFPSRYNKFLIEETTQENLLAGKVSLSPTGQWDYTAYEMPLSSPPSLDITLSYKIVEEGRLFVKDPNENTNVNFDTEDTKDNAVFDED